MSKQKLVKFDGVRVPVVDLSDNLGVCIGEAKTGKHRSGKEIKGTLNGVCYESKWAFSRMWWKPVGAVADDGQYILVVKRRFLPIFLMILIAIVVLDLIGLLMTGQDTVKNTVDYIGSKTRIIEPNKDVKGTIDEYSSFESVPENITWTAGSAEQSITLKNLDGNTVELAPQIYVDLNNDGNFTDDECFFNADCSKRIQPGNSVDKITLNKEMPAGTYKAEVVYKAFDSDVAVNGMNFDFTVAAR